MPQKKNLINILCALEYDALPQKIQVALHAGRIKRNIWDGFDSSLQQKKTWLQLIWMDDFLENSNTVRTNVLKM